MTTTSTSPFRLTHGTGPFGQQIRNAFWRKSSAVLAIAALAGGYGIGYLTDHPSPSDTAGGSYVGLPDGSSVEVHAGEALPVEVVDALRTASPEDQTTMALTIESALHQHLVLVTGTADPSTGTGFYSTVDPLSTSTTDLTDHATTPAGQTALADAYVAAHPATGGYVWTIVDVTN